MHASNHGLIWTGDVSPDREGYSGARNRVVNETLEESPDNPEGIMWVDSDITPEPSSITRLLATAQKNGYDFLTGIYHQRNGEYLPVIYYYGADEIDDLISFRQITSYHEDKVYEIGGCGFGFVYTSVKMLKAIKELPQYDREKGGYFPDNRNVKADDMFGEDLSFCFYAMKAGFQCYVDTGVIVGHQGDTAVIGKEDFRKKQQEKLEEAQAQWRLENC